MIKQNLLECKQFERSKDEADNGPALSFFFYAGDREEPVHIHIEREENIA